jgi:hypothetical protein
VGVDEADRAKHSSKQLRGQLRGVARGGGSARRQSTPPAKHCSGAYPPNLEFCKNRPKTELSTKFNQNQSCAQFYKLQNIFRCPKLILNGKRLILPDSLKIKLNSKEIQIFELGANQDFKNYFCFS